LSRAAASADGPKNCGEPADRDGVLEPRSCFQVLPLLGLALCCAAPAARGETCAEPARAQGTVPWVALEAPAPDAELESPLPLIELRGRAGTAERLGLDLVLAIDASPSALYPSGRDLDGDGITARLRQPLGAGGALRPARWWTTDEGDTVLRAELAAARELLRRLDPQRDRVALLSFAARSRVRAALGPPARVRRALASLAVPLRRGGTDLASALRVGAGLLGDPARGQQQPPRARLLLLLSDGEATEPAPPAYARRAVLRSAQQAAARGIRIHALALGDNPDGAALLAELAELGGGRFAQVLRSGDAAQLLPAPPLGEIAALELHNRSAARPGRALRLFADGSFDGFLPLVPGANLLELRVRSRAGASCELQRRIHYTPGAARTAAELAPLRELRDALALRSLQPELAARARLRRLRIEPAPRARGVAAPD
jgi:hypothetical protein